MSVVSLIRRCERGGPVGGVHITGTPQRPVREPRVSPSMRRARCRGLRRPGRSPEAPRRSAMVPRSGARWLCCVQPVVAQRPSHPPGLVCRRTARNRRTLIGLSALCWASGKRARCLTRPGPSTLAGRRLTRGHRHPFRQPEPPPPVRAGGRRRRRRAQCGRWRSAIGRGPRPAGSQFGSRWSTRDRAPLSCGTPTHDHAASTNQSGHRVPQSWRRAALPTG